MVDPLPDLRPYLDALQETGAKLLFVIDTHVHSDHLSGAHALAQATGAQLVMHHSAALTVPFAGMHDGEHLVMGNVDLLLWHTPGHTPEHLSVLVADRRRGAEPWFVLSGHTLMVGDAGRPDLAPQQLVSELYDSLQRYLTLPDHVEIYPGAFAGST